MPASTPEGSLDKIARGAGPRLPNVGTPILRSRFFPSARAGAHEARPYGSEVGAWLVHARSVATPALCPRQQRTISAPFA